jgi:hypothetical protein
MFGVLYLLGTFFANLFKPQRRLEIENLCAENSDLDVLVMQAANKGM